MAISNQNSTRRALNELLTDLSPASPIDHGPAAQRFRGHQRSHSSPNVPSRSVRVVILSEIEAQVGRREGRPSIDVLDLARVSQDVQHISAPPPVQDPPVASSSTNHIPIALFRPIRDRPMHPFAAVVAMMEEGESPTKRRMQIKGKAKATEDESDGRLSVTERQLKHSTRLTTPGSSRSPRRPETSTAFLQPPPRPGHLSPLRYVTATHTSSSPYGSRHVVPDVEMVEIPRFKVKELHLGMVQGQGPWRLAWLILWIWWLLSGLLGLFFDTNILYMLIQCVIHPQFNGSKSWAFATAAYAICWGISTLVVWLCWEIGYEFWRRWRLKRPAIEPIYLSFPANLHLSLTSFHHFVFLAYIRLSCLGTPYSRDVIPETCHSFIQLGPGLLPLLPRAAIALVLLLSFDKPEGNVQTPFGATDESRLRDSHFFQTDPPGELTTYAKGVLITFVASVGFRLIVVGVSGVGLWTFSHHPLGGILGSRFKHRRLAGNIAHRGRVDASTIRDPSKTTPPRRSWLESENEFDWRWRNRVRGRIQDAFEVCLIRLPIIKDKRIELVPLASSRSTSSQSGLPAERSDSKPQIPLTPSPDQQREVTIAGPRERRSASMTHDLRPELNNIGVDVFKVMKHHRHSDSKEIFAAESDSLLENKSPCYSRNSTPTLSPASSVRRRASMPLGNGAISRARSTSVSLLKESLTNGAGIIKRARSGTMMSSDSQYSRLQTEDLGRSSDDITSNTPTTAVICIGWESVEEPCERNDLKEAGETSGSSVLLDWFGRNVVQLIVDEYEGVGDAGVGIWRGRDVARLLFSGLSTERNALGPTVAWRVFRQEFGDAGGEHDGVETAEDEHEDEDEDEDEAEDGKNEEDEAVPRLQRFLEKKLMLGVVVVWVRTTRHSGESANVYMHSRRSFSRRSGGGMHG